MNIVCSLMRKSGANTNKDIILGPLEKGLCNKGYDFDLCFYVRGTTLMLTNAEPQF